MLKILRNVVLLGVVLSTALRSQEVDLQKLTGQIDAAKIVAHADTVRRQTGIYFPNTAALALSWKETRSGQSGNSARGPGLYASKLDRKHVCTTKNPCVLGDSIKICRELGRLQLSPCHDYTKIDPRCTYQAIRDSLDTNIHCGLLWFVEKLKLCNNDIACGIERYNGNGCAYMHGKKWCSEDYRKEALEYIGGLNLKGWREHCSENLVLQ